MYRARVWLRSEWFFYAILLLFAIETAWVILTLAFPGIFDEGWHYQIIAQHAKHLSPILTSQSPDTYYLGNITYDPSFLYHYLLSLPYRLLTAFGANDTFTIIALRFINLAMVAVSLVLFRRIFFAIGASRATSHVVLLFFILIPIIPFLAAQINNDNLVIVWVALSVLLLIRWRESLKAKQPSPLLFLWAAAAALFGAMSQYVFLPILAFVGIVLLGDLVGLARQGLSKLRLHSLMSRWGIMSIISFLVAAILFGASYGVNIAKYHSPVPSCDRVLTTQQCLTYYTFNRNYTAKHTNPPVDPNPIKFTAGWLYRLYNTSFYTVLGKANAPLQVPAFPLPALTAGVLLLAGAILFAFHSCTLVKRHPDLLIALGAAVFFTAVLWLHNYQDFIELKAKVGINGRYLLLVTPLIMIAAALALQRALRARPQVAYALLIVAFVLFLQGGGVVTYVVASDAAWWWPSPTVKQVAQTVHNIVAPLVVRFPLFW
jgi:hypothetical protein